MKRTPLLLLLCLAFLFFSLFHLEPSNAESESSTAVLVHEPFSQREDKLKPDVPSRLIDAGKFGTQEILSATSINRDQDQKSDVTVVASYQNDTSIPVRKMKPRRVSNAEHEANENPTIPVKHKDSPDPVVQDRFDILTSLATPNMPSTMLNFDGIPVSCNCIPPDTNGEVGATHYVQIANRDFQVFDKTTGASLLGPIGISTIWSGFGGPCETAGKGDPVVLYDQLANRWVISQFAGVGNPTDECVAVSTTSDATGSYNRYAFHLGSNFFDYPKLAVWPDAYYMAMNVFNQSTGSYMGPQPFALDRTSMLAGLPATFITTGITGGSSEAPYLPVDLDGTILPPPGAPASFIQWPATGTYRVSHFHVDFANPLNSTFTLFANPAAAGFTQRTTGIPQLGTTSVLDPVGDRLMFRAATRFFADGHESLVTNFTVQSGSVAAVRWFELRNPTVGPVTVFQQGTYQPNTTHRWMGSAGMDQQGNLAIGYSASSSSINPQIRYAGRLVTDALNTLPQAEVTLFAGTGSQTGSRWGDYTAMTIDPVDDCTFWYTNEYYATTSNFNWRTRIGSFKFTGCIGTPPVTQTLTVASSNPISGVSIAVNPLDNNGLGSGITRFTRTYNQNTVVSLTAPTTTAGGNTFQKWQRNGADYSFNPMTTVTLDTDYTMRAVYVTPTRTLTVASTNPASGVSVGVSPLDNNGLGNGTTQFTRTYNQNTTVSLTAPATAGGNNFQKWQRNGADYSNNPATSVTLDADYTMTAIYVTVTPPRTLTVGSTNPASGVNVTVSPNDNSGLGNETTQFTRTYNQNTVVSLTAPSTAGVNNFQKWQRNGVDWATTQATTVTLDANYTMTAVYVSTENVFWTNPVGVTTSGNSLTKTALDNWGNAGAVSTQAIVSGDGYVEFTASETNLARMCGLGNGDFSQNYPDIEFAIQLTASDGTNGVWVFESGTLRGNFGTYTGGDKFRVAVEGGAVKYSKNGTVFYTSTLAPSYPLLVDTSLYSNGSTVTNVIISGKLNVNIQNVAWTNLVGVTASGNSLTKTALDNWGNAGAVSTQAISSGDGYVEFTASETNLARMCGLANGDAGQNYPDIEFAIQLTASDGTNGVWVFESGSLRGNFGTYTAGDKFRVAVEGGVVKYSKNGTLFYSSTIAPSYPLLVDTSLYSNGTTLTNVIISGNLGGG